MQMQEKCSAINLFSILTHFKCFVDLKKIKNKYCFNLYIFSSFPPTNAYLTQMYKLNFLVTISYSINRTRKRVTSTTSEFEHEIELNAFEWPSYTHHSTPCIYNISPRSRFNIFKPVYIPPEPIANMQTLNCRYCALHIYIKLFVWLSTKHVDKQIRSP